MDLLSFNLCELLENIGLIVKFSSKSFLFLMKLGLLKLLDNYIEDLKFSYFEGNNQLYYEEVLIKFIQEILKLILINLINKDQIIHHDQLNEIDRLAQIVTELININDKYFLFETNTVLYRIKQARNLKLTF